MRLSNVANFGALLWRTHPLARPGIGRILPLQVALPQRIGARGLSGKGPYPLPHAVSHDSAGHPPTGRPAQRNNHLGAAIETNDHTAQEDLTPPPGEDVLPVVEALRDTALAEGIDMSRTAVVYIHHALRTSVNVLDAMIAWGLRPENTFVLGKKYSENSDVVETMIARGVHYRQCSEQARLGQFNAMFVKDVNAVWELVDREYEDRPEAIDQILVLDHGGYGCSYMPAQLQRRYPVVGLEKTTAGIIKYDIEGGAPLPIINVAESAAKQHLESPLIAQAAWEKLLENIGDIPKGTVCGIAGFGHIGRAVAAKLIEKGYKVNVYDRHFIKPEYAQRVNVVNSFDTLVLTSNVIFGCSGRDVTRCMDSVRMAESDKLCISASSEDREFLTLLRAINKQLPPPNYTMGAPAGTVPVLDPFNDPVFTTESGNKVKVMHGGFPINFDSSGESVPADDIQLTRALTLAGVMQIMRSIQQGHHPRIGLYALDADLQSYVALRWLNGFSRGRYNGKAATSFRNIDWIVKNSKGEPFLAKGDSDSLQEPNDLSGMYGSTLFYNHASTDHSTGDGGQPHSTNNAL